MFGACDTVGLAARAVCSSGEDVALISNGIKCFKDLKKSFLLLLDKTETLRDLTEPSLPVTAQPYITSKKLSWLGNRVKYICH